MKRLLLILLAALAVHCASAQSGNKNSSTPPAKRPAQARTQAEFADFNAAYAVTGGAAMEKAATDFSTKYPTSELRVLLLVKALHEYQVENDHPKMLAMGEKVLALDPENAVALVLTATVLSDDLNDSDPDRAQKATTVKKNAGHALDTMDATIVLPAGVTAEQLEAYKNTLRSMAHSALGITALKSGDNANAEKELKTAIDLSKAKPDPYDWYHLALAQDHQGTAAANAEDQQRKYAEALVSVRAALGATPNPDLAKLAQGELKRLLQLTGQDTGQPSPSQRP